MIPYLARIFSIGGYTVRTLEMRTIKSIQFSWFRSDSVLWRKGFIGNQRSEPANKTSLSSFPLVKVRMAG